MAASASRSRWILEHTGYSNLLTSGLIGTNAAKHSTIVTRNADFGDALRRLFGPAEVSVFHTTSELPASTKYDFVVSAPPINYKPKDIDEADGFGGEAILSLVSHLGSKGTIYWVTARGAIFSAASKRTLSALETAGLGMTACVETAPGVLLGTMIDGVVFAFQRNAPGKILSAALRTPDDAPSIASALLAGPTDRRASNWLWVNRNDFRTFSALEQERLLRALLPRGS
jgi:hypothetical protein